MQKHERLVGKPSEPDRIELKNWPRSFWTSNGLGKAPGLLGLYHASLPWLEGKVSATIWTELGQKHQEQRSQYS